MSNKLTWTPEKRKLADLREWEHNPRKITEEQFEKLKASITARGFHDVLKIDTDGTIVSGHQRKRALSSLGIKEIYVMVPSRPLTETERNVIAIESNRHSGTFDFDILANDFELADLLEGGFTQRELTGFGPIDLETPPKEKKEKTCPECGAIIR